MSRSRILLGGALLLIAAGAALIWNSPRFPELAAADDKAVSSPTSDPFPSRKKLPANAFEGGKEWLNVSGPVELRDLHGKIVVVDFWTFCCINCMHVLPDLKFLEQKYPKELIVVGVHSAKFENEKETENIRRAILRYEIEHPVVNDAEMTIWRRFGTRSWPTLVVIDPLGQVIGAISGEGHREILDQVVSKLVAYHKANGTLDTTPLNLGLERNKQQPTPLRFPGKIIADEAGDRLYISDSNHNRIVVSTLAGKLVDTIGSGALGSNDGSFGAATFDHPQGMALHDGQLYVADTENHLIRAIDLAKKTVGTLAGTGKQGGVRDAGGPLRETPLNSPWDLLINDDVLYIAMAGPHQIWSHKLGSNSLQLLAGSGKEDILNGERGEAAFAQPSGLASDGKSLFVADSEGSAIRQLALSPGGSVTTIAGTSDLEFGQSLFAFGDVDGVGNKARFQHPLGLAYRNGRVYVADSYNHKIKSIDLATKRVDTFLGSGHRGNSVSPPEFSEPAGLAFAAGKVYIADTNNHVIKLVDLPAKTVTELPIEGLAPPTATTPVKPVDEFAGLTAESIPPQKVAAGDSLTLDISFKLPDGYKLNQEAPASLKLHVQKPTDLIAADELAKRHRAKVELGRATVTIPLAGKSGQAVLDGAFSFTYCRDGKGGVCKLGSARWTIPVEIADGATQRAVSLTAVVDSPISEAGAGLK